MCVRILVVDDHDVVRQGVRLILRKRPEWEVCGEAENGSEALEKARKLKPDVVILDITMPGKDGLEVAQELAKWDSPPKVLILTMHDSRELAGAVRQAGVQGYVVKTHSARDLISAIEKIVGGGTFFSIDSKPGAE